MRTKTQLNILLFALCFAFAHTASAQLIAVTKDGKARKEYTRKIKQQEREAWDITPQPGEAPQKVKRLTAFGVTENNWGVIQILPQSVKVELARRAAQSGHKVRVKVFDTAGNPDHPYLKQGRQPGADYTGENNLQDGNGHGTHVGGIIAGDFGLGVLDTLIDLGLVTHDYARVLNSSGSGSFSWIANAIRQEDNENRTLIQRGEYVVCNFSLGGGTAKNAEVEAALKASTELGVTYCIAAGNTSGAGVQYPGNSQYAICCAAIGQNQKRASFSTTGPEVWSAMPGVSINSTWRNGQFASLSGTSMATPYLTSAAAIAYVLYGPKIKGPAEMKRYLAHCANDLETPGKDNLTGWGVNLIKKILDTDPARIPAGLPGENPNNPGDPNPPNNPNPPAPITREMRPLTFTVSGPFSVFWDTQPGSASDTTFTIQNVKVTRTGKYRAKAMKELVIPELQFTVNSNTDAITAQNHVEQSVRWFFDGRGLILKDGWDYADATYWTAFFLEMIVQTQAPVKLSGDVNEIQGIHGLDKTRKITYYWPQLKRFAAQ